MRYGLPDRVNYSSNFCFTFNANPVVTSVISVSQTSGVTTRLPDCHEPPFSLVYCEHRNLNGRPSIITHPKNRRAEMSQDHNLFVTTSKDSSSPARASSFNNNTNSFNNTINNVSNHFIVPEDRLEILAWLSPLEPRIRHQNLEAGRVDKVGDWLLQTEQFRNWSGGNSRDEPQNAAMLCHGNPGAGKTYIW